MAHYAFLDENNIVIEVITGVDETEIIEGKSPEVWYEEFRGKKCVRTSYNTYGGKHIKNGNPFRKNYAAIGYHFDGVGFYAPQPFPSWSLNKETYLWEAPIAYPEDGKFYIWNEEVQNWVEIN